MNEEQLKHRIALHKLPGIGPVSARALISYCGSVEDIFRKKKALLEKIPGIGKERAALVHRKGLFDDVEKEIKFIRKNNIVPLFYTDENFPARLKNCDDSPLMLFYKGNVDLNPEKMIAIVGTRFMTSYGKSVTEQVIDELAKYSVTVVSGLAYGVDIHAHRCAIKADLSTIGVVAHGLDKLYPSENRSTAETMLKNGGIITEYTSGTKPDKVNFPARNRIVAGMCDAVLVIESAVKGGALITAELANDYNRDVFAFPGRVTDNYSTGCNKLISLNKAMLVESGDHIASIMQWDNVPERNIKRKNEQLEMFHSLSADEQKLIEVLKKNGKLGIDSIAIEADTPVSTVSTLLLNLEFAGMLRSLPGKIYELI
jgi:DNA processing protein